MKEFLLSDETVNSYGFVVLTSGMNMERFNKNPVMFLNHDRKKGIAGKWKDLRIEDGKLYGTPVFDMEHEPGKTSGEQVESGFLNGASIGISNLLMSDVNGVETAVSCELDEVSVCDLPSNQNALQLYYKGLPVTLSKYKELSFNNKEMETTDLKKIALALSLPEGATADEICTEIKNMAAMLPGSVTLMMENAVKRNIISREESKELVEMAGNNIVSLNKFLQKREQAMLKALSSKYDKYVSENSYKFTGMFGDEKLKQLALQDFDTFKRFADMIPKPLKPMDVISMSAGNGKHQKPKCAWTLEDYRKLAPMELEKDPELYQSLIREERERKKRQRN